MMRKVLLSLVIMMSLGATSQDFCFNEMTYAPEATTFRLFAPKESQTVKVRIYQQGLGGKALKTIKMKYADGLWSATVKGDMMGRFYTFDIGKGECPGVFAKAVGVNGQRAAIVQM